MSFRLSKDIFNTPTVLVPCANTFTGAKGSLVMADTANNIMIAATSASTVANLFGVINKTVVSGETSVEVIPIVSGPGQTWEADMTNNTAADQLLERAALSNSTSVNNTGTTVAGPTGVWTSLVAVGAAADKKTLGYFNVTGQVTA